MRNSIVLCTVLLAVGCAENRHYFRPTEHVYGETAHGDQEAIYQLVGPFGPFGEAKLWSEGAFREDDASIVHVNIALHNTSGVPIQLKPDQIRLDPVRVGRKLLRNIPPLNKETAVVAPGGFAVMHLEFALPAAVRPGEVSSFGVRWKADNGPQSYTQRTPFTELGGRYAYGYPGMYDFGYGYFCSPFDAFCDGGWGYPIGGPGYVATPNAGVRGPRVSVHVR